MATDQLIAALRAEEASLTAQLATVKATLESLAAGHPLKRGPGRPRKSGLNVVFGVDGTAQPAPRQLSDEGRAAISAAAKKRWARVRKEKKAAEMAAEEKKAARKKGAKKVARKKSAPKKKEPRNKKIAAEPLVTEGAS